MSNISLKKKYSVAIFVGILSFTRPIHAKLIHLHTKPTFAAEQQLSKMGEQVIANLYVQNAVIEDAIIDDYLQQLTQKLQAPLNKKIIKKIVLINDHEVNAFALPGGIIGVHAGLIETTHDESELAAVLAHEISHVYGKHIERSITASKQMTLPTFAALFGSMALATVSPQAGMAAASATMAGIAQRQIQYTLKHEKEADRLGINLLTEAGFNPHAMAYFFKRLAQKSRYNSKPPSFLNTHPLYEQRIAESLNHDIRTGSKLLYRQNKLFTLIKIRSQLLSSHQLTQYTQASEKPSHQYAKALSLHLNNKNKKAEKIILPLSEKYPQINIYSLLYINILLAQNKNDTALTILQERIKHQPHDFPLALVYAKTLIENNHYSKAITRLSHEINQNPHPLLYETLAKAQYKADFKAESHVSLASSLSERYLYKSAIAQLNIAKQRSSDRYLLAAINAKIKTFSQHD